MLQLIQQAERKRSLDLLNEATASYNLPYKYQTVPNSLIVRANGTSMTKLLPHAVSPSLDTSLNIRTSLPQLVHPLCSSRAKSSKFCCRSSRRSVSGCGD